MKKLCKRGLLYLIFCHAFIQGHGQNVSFDSTFGLNARTYTQLGSPQGFSSVYKFTTVKPDGSFYMGGDYNQPDTNFFVTKFKINGSIDSSYGVNGKLYTKRADFGVSQILASGMDSSFRFLFVGRIPSPSGPFYFLLRVVRYTAAAKVDSSFGVNGIADIPFDNNVNSGINYFITAYRDGRLLVTALMGENAVLSNALFRLKTNGTLDSSFASNGKLFLPPSSGITNFLSLNLQTDEKIVFARHFNASLFLFRYNTNGTIDNSFNGTGSMNVDYPVGNNGLDGIRILSTNKILLAAGTGAGHYLYRFKTNGQRDSTFGTTGFVPYNYGFKTWARDFAEQPDGKILSAGVIQDNQQPFPNVNTLITRTNIDGSIDSTFDNDGVWFFNYGGNPASGMKHLNLLSNAKMLFSGLESGADWTQFVTYRLKEAYQLSAVAWGSAASILVNYDCSTQVRLNWSTLTETNIAYFRIEHSTNNIQFNSIAQVTATGNSSVPVNYSYLHTAPPSGSNYYRITAVAINGQQFVNGTLSIIVPPTTAPLFEWLSHEIIKRPGNECLQSIKLNFRTLRPVISDSIVLEYSTDSVNFTVLAKIKVSNPQGQITNYDFTHNNPVFGKNFYRLRTNGPVSFCSSLVYTASLKNVNELKIYPVPASDRLFFDQPLPPGTRLTVFDMKGSLVIDKEISSAVNELFIAHLSSGQYIMKISISCTEKTFKFMKIIR